MSSSTVSDKLSKVVGPENSLGRLNSSVTFTCMFDNSCHLVEWYHNSRPLYRNGFFRQFRNRSTIENSSQAGVCTSRLTVSELRWEDSGIFACFGYVYTDRDYHFTKEAELMVVDFNLTSCLSGTTGHVRFTSGDDVIFTSGDDVVENESVEISCQVHTRANLSHLRVLLRNMDVRAIVSSSRATTSVHHLAVARAPYVPVHRCSVRLDYSRSTRPDHATNSPTMDVCETNAIQVAYPVRNIRLQPNKTALEPGTEIRCLADGYPKPNIWWAIESTSASASSSTSSSASSSAAAKAAFPTSNDSSKIVILRLVENTYRCFAQNTIKRRTYVTNTSCVVVYGSNVHARNEGHETLIASSFTGSHIGTAIMAVLLVLITVAFVVYHVYVKRKSGQQAPDSQDAVCVEDLSPANTYELKQVVTDQTHESILYEDVRPGNNQSIIIVSQDQYDDRSKSLDSALYSDLSQENREDWHAYCQLQSK